MSSRVTTVNSRSVRHSAVQTHMRSLVYEFVHSSSRSAPSVREVESLAQQLEVNNRTYLRLRELLLNRAENAELLNILWFLLALLEKLNRFSMSWATLQSMFVLGCRI